MKLWKQLTFLLSGLSISCPLSAQEQAGEGSFADFTVTDGYIDTGEWMGTLYAGHYPWVYFYTTDTWGYDAGNNWIYFDGEHAVSRLYIFDNPGEWFGSFYRPRITSNPVTYKSDVNTWDWLEWVYVDQHPWVYFYSFGTWAYDHYTVQFGTQYSDSWFYVLR